MERKATSYGVLTILIWGSSFAAIRASLEGGFSPGHLLAFRFIIASLFFILFALVRRDQFRIPDGKDWPLLLILGFVGITVYHYGVTFGEMTVSAGTAGLLVSSAPIFTTLLAIVVLKERLSAGGWLGLIVGFIGVGIIMLGAGEQFTITKDVVFIVIAAFATSIFFVYQKTLFMRYRPIELTAYFTWAGTLPFLLLTPGLGTTLQHATTEALVSAIFLGIFPAAIAYVLWAVALQQGNIGVVTSLIYFEPVVAIIVAYIWLGELPTALSMVGGAIAISSVLIIHYVNRRRTPPVA